MLDDGDRPQPWLDLPSETVGELPSETVVLYSALDTPPPASVPKCESFQLDLATTDRLTVEMRRLSLITLHGVQRQLHVWGFDREAAFVHNFIFHEFNCRVPATAEIGEGTTLAYGGIGVVVHKDSKIGMNVKIGQNVTLGARAGGSGPPIIGDDVFIGPNSVCLGGEIGSGAVVGAGSVVLKPVAAGAVVAGNPARVIRGPSLG
ncbi:serine O-acetyltransferase [Agrococcus sp. Ld7]|uniref:serine O-acetyltransferase n=1 Tax=Agrococcus sp. Ld7 TaxID=649148 RepID=UPI00386BDEAD